MRLYDNGLYIGMDGIIQSDRKVEFGNTVYIHYNRQWFNLNTNFKIKVNEFLDRRRKVNVLSVTLNFKDSFCFPIEILVGE